MCNGHQRTTTGGIYRVLKIHPQWFEAVAFGPKRFEIRRNDRKPAYHVGDVLILGEWDETGWTGRAVAVTVLRVYENMFGIPIDGRQWCILIVSDPQTLPPWAVHEDGTFHGHTPDVQARADCGRRPP